MQRYFEIIEHGVRKGPQKFDLPLVVGNSDKCHIRLGDAGAEICFIGEDHGHLFLQPVSDEVEVFHNRERIRASVWIKSGDVTRIGSHQLVYDISGDVVTIRVSRAEDVQPLSPSEQSLDNVTPPVESTPLPRVASHSEKGVGSSLFLKIALPVLGILVLSALFLLFSKVFQVKITPQPDSISFRGLLPVIDAGDRYLALYGKYTLHAEKRGYAPLDETIDLAGSGKGLFEFEMRLPPGIVSFTTEPERGVEILIDKISVGLTPLSDIEVDAGRHIVQARLERYRPFEQEIMVQGRRVHQEFHLTLEPSWGWVEVSSEPSGALVDVDGNSTGISTPATLELSEGEHVIALKLEKYLPGRVNVNVTAGAHHQIETVKLRPAPGLLLVDGTPQGALVAVGGVFAGKLPCKKEVPSGRVHEITVTAPGYSSTSRKVEVEAGEKKTVHLELSPLIGTVFISCAPSGAELYIDGKRQAKNSGRFRLTAVPHILEARAQGFSPVRKRIKVVAGSSQAVELRFDSVIGAATEKRHAKGASPAVKGLVLVRPHVFTMGSSRREQGRRTNEVLHKVGLSRPFYIGAREVTNAEFRRFMAKHSSGSFSGHTLNGEMQPVVNVSWEDAARFCNYLSKKEALPLFYNDNGKKISVNMPPNTGYRLPTEAEWAFAARVLGRAASAKYPWKGGYPPPDRSGNFADESARGVVATIIDGYNDGFAVSAPAGSFKPTSAGLYDIGGNVSEWCNDFYSPVPPPNAGKDPLGPAAGTHHVIRGSSWQDSSMTELRLSYRAFGNKPADYVGFRVARYAE